METSLASSWLQSAFGHYCLKVTMNALTASLGHGEPCYSYWCFCKKNPKPGRQKELRKSGLARWTDERIFPVPLVNEEEHWKRLLASQEPGFTLQSSFSHANLVWHCLKHCLRNH